MTLQEAQMKLNIEAIKWTLSREGYLDNEEMDLQDACLDFLKAVKKEGTFTPEIREAIKVYKEDQELEERGHHEMLHQHSHLQPI